MTRIVFAREQLTETVWDEALPLLEAHWREVAHYSDITLSPDRSLYEASERAGVLRFYSARDWRDERTISDDEWPWHFSGAEQAAKLRACAPLVGYALFFVRPNPHYSGSIQAAQDVLYLDPRVRGITGYRFVAWCDEQLRIEGVQAVYHHQKRAHPQLGRVLDKLGYEPVDVIWARRLDRGDHERDHRRGVSRLQHLGERESEEAGESSAAGISNRAHHAPAFTGKPQHCIADA